MGKRQRQERERQRKAKRYFRAVVITLTAIFVVSIFVYIALSNNNTSTSSTDSIKVAKNSDGSLAVPVSELGPGLNYIDYGYERSILALTDAEGVVRTAYNTCLECYLSGNAHYTLSNSQLTCRACGNSYSVDGLGTPSWGGCQPVSIPPEYREDNEDEIVFPSKLLAFAEDMFSQWNNGEFDTSLQYYVYMQ